MMGTLAPWALLEKEEIQVWLACLEHRGPQDSRSDTCWSSWPTSILSALLLTIVILTIILKWVPIS